MDKENIDPSAELTREELQTFLIEWQNTLISLRKDVNALLLFREAITEQANFLTDQMMDLRLKKELRKISIPAKGRGGVELGELAED